jgi:hypothetical protein
MAVCRECGLHPPLNLQSSSISGVVFGSGGATPSSSSSSGSLGWRHWMKFGRPSVVRIILNVANFDQRNGRPLFAFAIYTVLAPPPIQHMSAKEKRANEHQQNVQSVSNNKPNIIFIRRFKLNIDWRFSNSNFKIRVNFNATKIDGWTGRNVRHFLVDFDGPHIHLYSSSHYQSLNKIFNLLVALLWVDEKKRMDGIFKSLCMEAENKKNHTVVSTRVGNWRLEGLLIPFNNRKMGAKEVGNFLRRRITK